VLTKIQLRSSACRRIVHIDKLHQQTMNEVPVELEMMSTLRTRVVSGDRREGGKWGPLPRLEKQFGE